MNDFKPCYECSREYVELSQRSRCVDCEFRRAKYNENEAAKFREALYTIVYNDTEHSPQKLAAMALNLKMKL